MNTRNRCRRQPLSPAAAQIQSLERRLVLSGINCCGTDLQPAEIASLSIGETDDVGISSSDSASAQSSGAFNGRINFRNRNDWFRLDVTETQNANIRLSGLTGDLSLQLYSQRGALLGTSDNGGTANESIDRELTPGRYFIRVSGRGTGSYRLDWDLESNIPDDFAGNTLSTANNLGVVDSTTVTDWVGPADRADVYQFTVTEQSEVSLRLEQLSANADLQLLNSAGQRITVSQRSGSVDEQITAVLGAGTYFTAVTSGPGDATTFSLTIDVESVVPEVPDIEPDVGSETPPPGTPFPDVPDLQGFNSWNLNAINAPEVWAQGYTGEGVVVAVVDTGVRLNHPDLLSNIWVNPGEIVGNGIDDDGNGFVDDINGWDFASNNNNPNDVNGHGTHVAGIIAAASNGFGATGVAFDTTILPVQVLGDNGSGSNFSVAQGIRYAVDNGADIVNLSLGGGFSSVVQSAIRYAELNDVLVVAAAGNDGAATPGYPARHSAQFSNTISVGAYDSSQQLAGFSNRVGNSGSVQVDAPGVSVYSTYQGGYARLSGTSMAAPNVAGVAALALSANGDLSAAELRTLIVQGATDGIAGSDSIGGINAASTVAFAAAGVTESGQLSSNASLSSQQNVGGRVGSFNVRTSFTPQTNNSSTARDRVRVVQVASPEFSEDSNGLISNTDQNADSDTIQESTEWDRTFESQSQDTIISSLSLDEIDSLFESPIATELFQL